MSQELIIRRTALYRHFDSQGALLYVGVSYDPDMRWHGHSKSEWRPQVDRARSTEEWFTDRESAEEAEEAAIAKEGPRFNKASRSRLPSYAKTTTSGPTTLDALTSEQVAELLGVQRKSVHQFTRYLDGFPAPALTVGRTPLWERKAIEAWRESHPARKRQS